MANTFAMISAGLWDANSATMQDIATRVNVDNTDLVYKIQKGYIGYSKGTSEGVFDITQTQWGFDYNLPMWDSVLKLFVNASPPPVVTPATPTGLTATAASSSAVTPTWADNANNETGYYVERKVGSAGIYQVIATLAANATTYGDSGLTASTQYYYRVRAFNGTVTSSYSAEASATTSAAISTSVILTPGTGFSGTTATPARMGSSSQFGYNDKVIAHWDTVPYQTVSGRLNVGIVAFHNSGIDRVEFSVNGGAWAAVRQMTLNPQTGVVEYWATLDASKFATDGKVEIRAIAYPNIGIPRVFQGAVDADNGEQSLFLNVNAGGTLASTAVYVSAATGSDSNTGTQASPFKTIGKAASALGTAADGGIIYLMAGDYTYGAGASSPTTSNRWLTITHAPGTTKSAVRVVGSSGYGLGTKLVHFYDLTFAPATGEAQYIMANTISEASVWVDNCNLIGPGRTVDATWGANDFSGVYVTNTTISACRDGIACQCVRECVWSERCKSSPGIRSPARNRELLRRREAGWEAAGGERLVRNTDAERRIQVNSIRFRSGTSLLANERSPDPAIKGGGSYQSQRVTCKGCR